MVNKPKRVNKYQIFIGTKDKDKLKQLLPKEDFIKMISNICVDYKICFSLSEQLGGYMMANGTFITENSIVLSIVGFNRQQIIKLAEELRKKFNQESILISYERTGIILITE